MCSATKTINRRGAFTLIEMLVVIGIILVIAALAAAFAPRVSDSQNLTRAVDSLEQWLLTAKMRAKRDQLATGIRFVPAPGDPAGTCSQFQYIQQPDPLSGGWVSTTNTSGSVPYVNGTFLTGGICMPTPNLSPPIVKPGQVLFGNVDFTLGGNALLVQRGDYLEVRDGGVYLIAGVVLSSPTNMLQLGSLSTVNTPGSVLYSPGPPPLYLTTTAYETSLSITERTTNYRILRQPRILIGEAELQMPNNFAVDTTLGGNVQATAVGNFDILFSPSGAVIGANAGSGKLLMIVHDLFANPTTSFDSNRAGIVGVQSRTGFIGAYSVAPGADPFAFVESGRESGL